MRRGGSRCKLGRIEGGNWGIGERRGPGFFDLEGLMFAATLLGGGGASSEEGVIGSKGMDGRRLPDWQQHRSR